ncbi:iron chaperone [Paenibacillus cymbidii]|uniref:iron chaperone n=1 Tax=Paenibacillus cymbidii TaxID=1639034 RepID=UPI001081B578|nr:iron chaperone [Paenibacillus cymbidii]
MEVFADYLVRIANPLHRERMEEVLTWVTKQFPHLEPKLAWNQPMYTDHGTFIIGFSAAKHHMAFAPERAGMIHFADKIAQSGYEYTKELVRVRWDRPVPYGLLENMIDFNITDKADCSTFWRK